MSERRTYRGGGMTLFPVERIIAVVSWTNTLTWERALCSWAGETMQLWAPERPNLGPNHGITEAWRPDPGAVPPPGIFVVSAFVRPPVTAKISQPGPGAESP